MVAGDQPEHLQKALEVPDLVTGPLSSLSLQRKCNNVFNFIINIFIVALWLAGHVDEHCLKRSQETGGWYTRRSRSLKQTKNSCLVRHFDLSKVLIATAAGYRPSPWIPESIRGIAIDDLNEWQSQQSQRKWKKKNKTLISSQKQQLLSKVGPLLMVCFLQTTHDDRQQKTCKKTWPSTN